MSLLSKWLERKGIKSSEDLTPEEKQVYDNYKLVLSGETLTVETIKTFCKNQVKVIEDKFAEGDNTDKKDNYLKACLHVYLNLIKAIEAPEAERASLERYLNQLI